MPATPHLMTEHDTLRARAEALHLHGLLAHWPRSRPNPGSRRCSTGRSRNAPAAAWSVDCAPPISAASSRSATSTGPGPSAATAPPSTR